MTRPIYSLHFDKSSLYNLSYSKQKKNCGKDDFVIVTIQKKNHLDDVGGYFSRICILNNALKSG